MLKHEHTVTCRTSTELRRQLALLEGTFGGAGLTLASEVAARVWRDDESGEVIVEIQEASA